MNETVHVSEYHDSMVAFLEWIWGRDYMAPGGEGNVDRMVAGLDLAGRRVLDIGCGIGGPAIALARKYGAEVTGIDLEPQLVARANRRAEELGLSDRVEFRTVTLGDLPFPDRSFDLVFTSGALTQTDGSYSIAGLPPGNYQIYAEPLDSNSTPYFGRSDLTSFYSSLVTDFAASQDWSFSVGAGQTANVDIPVQRGNPALDSYIVYDAGVNGFLNIGTTVQQGANNVRVGVAGVGLPQSGTPLSITGSGITIVRHVFVTTNTGLPGILVDINVAANAAPGPRNIVVSNGSQRTIVSGGVEVLGGAAPPPPATAVSAANFQPSIAAESIAALFGTNLATGTTAATGATLPTSLGGVSLRVRDGAGQEQAAPLFFVSPQQINFLVPPNAASGDGAITLVKAAEVLKVLGGEKQVDIIGLSGLITPSLDEMQHVAREMQREGFTTPLLIGGATTSRVHTAVKIAPNYEPPVVHVLDASRAVPAVGALINPESRANFALANQRQQTQDRDRYEAGREQRTLRTLADARANATPIDWAASEIAVPDFTGLRTIDALPLETLVPFIDWSPFFHTWELAGVFPRILDDAVVGPQARKLYDDARALLDRIVAGRLLTARGVYGFWPANAVGDDIEVYADPARSRILTTFHTLRQQGDKRAGQHNQALADFIAPKSSGRIDYLGAFAVTAGIGVEALCARFDADHDDYNSIMTKALADRLAEAFAEYLHLQARRDWGYGREENLLHEDLIKERYRGIRPAPGYPACPDHTEKRLLFDLLEAEKNAGIELTESFAMTPASSVSGLYFSHPEAQYFVVGRIDRDQVEDYAARKGLPVAEVERWLAPNLH